MMPSRLVATVCALVFIVVFTGLAQPPGAAAYLTGTASQPPPASGPYGYNTFVPGSSGFPATGQTYADPVFNETIRRLTNEASFVESGDSEIYSKNGYQNADNTLMYHRRADGSRHIIDSSTGAVVCGNLPLSGVQGADSSFDPVDPTIWYYFSGTQLRRYFVTLTSCVPDANPVKTFSAALGPLGGSVDWIDNSGRYMVLNVGGTVHVWDRLADQLYGGGFNFNAFTANGDGWVGISPDGKYLVTAGAEMTHYSFAIDHVGKTLGSPVLFWTMCGGHADLVSASDGKTYYVSFDCHTSGDIYRVDVTIPQTSSDPQKQRTDNLMVVDLDAPPGNWADVDGHFSGVSKGPLKDWVFVSINSGDDDFNSGVGTWRRYKAEVFMVNVLTKEVRRLAHHRSRSVDMGYIRQPRVSVSWDGGKVTWASNFNLNNGLDYADIYSISISAGGGGGGGGDTTPPTVAVTAPANGSTVAGTQTVTATATDNIAVVGVQFKLNGADLGGEDTAAPYSVTWNTTLSAQGTHTLTAVARDAAGNRTTSNPVSVIVNNPNTDTTAPTVSITAPENGTTVSGTQTLTATANDNVGVVGVQFKLDGANLGAEDTSAPYSINWDTSGVATGTHTLTAVARDAAGNFTTSAAVTVTVSSPGAPQPVVWTSVVGFVTVNGNSLSKNSGCQGCADSGAVSQQQITAGDGYVEFTTSNVTAEAVLGLSTGNPGTSGSEIKFAMYIGDGVVTVRENGTARRQEGLAVGDVLRVAVVGGVVKYYKNGALLYSSSVTTTYPLLVDTSLWELGSNLQNVVIAGAAAGGGSGVQNVVWTSATGPVSVNGNSLSKTSGCNGCADAGAVSQQQIAAGDGYVQFTVSNTTAERYLGLSTGNPGTSGSEIKFAFNVGDGAVTVRENGVYRTDAVVSPGDVLRIAIVGGVVKYYRNGALMYSSVAPTYPLLVDTSLWELGSDLLNVIISGVQ